MRLLFVIASAGKYGSERHVLDLVRHFHGICDVKCVSFGSGPLLDTLQAEGIPCELVDFPSWLPNRNALAALRKLTKAFRPDIIHLHQPRAVFYAFAFAGLGSIVRIATLHSTPRQHAANRTGLTRLAVLAFHYLVQAVAMVASHKVVFVSRTSQAAAIRTAKGAVLHNWLPIDCKIPEQSIPQWNGSEPLRIVSVSSIVRAKGVESVLALLEMLQAAGLDFRFELVGDGEPGYVEWYKGQIQRSPVANRVALVGYSPDVSSYLKRAHVFLSLTHDETFGLTFVEAMAHGLPVICSDIPVMREVVHPGNFFVDIKDGVHLPAGMLDVLGNPASLAEMGMANLQWVRSRYLQEARMQDYQKFYSGLIPNRIP